MLTSFLHFSHRTFYLSLGVPRPQMTVRSLQPHISLSLRYPVHYRRASSEGHFTNYPPPFLMKPYRYILPAIVKNANFGGND